MKENNTKEENKSICPACGNTISYLISRKQIVEEHVVYGTEEGNLDFNLTDKYDSPTGISFFCPKCRKRVATSRKIAARILTTNRNEESH